MVDACIASGIQGIDFRGIGEEIDITRSSLFTTEIDSTLGMLRASGIEMPCLNTSVTLVTPAADRWQMFLEETQRYAQLAEQSQTKWLRIFGGKVPKEITRDEARVLAQRHLRQVIKIARNHGCRPLIELHDDWATSGEVLELLHEFDPADTGVIWDVEHPYRKGEAITNTAERLKKFIHHAHIKDSIRRPEGYTAMLLGKGELPLAEFQDALRQIGYDAWMCLETEKRWYAAAPEPEESVPQFAGFMKSN